MKLRTLLLTTALVSLLSASLSVAQVRYGTGTSSGSSTFIANSTLTSGFSANNIPYSDGSKVQAASGLTFSGGAIASETISPVVNSTALTISGGSITGSSTVSPGISVAGTLNTSGVVPGAGLNIAVTDTAHGAGTTLLNILGGSAGTTGLLSLSTAGVLTIGASSTNGGITTNGISFGYITPGLPAGGQFNGYSASTNYFTLSDAPAMMFGNNVPIKWSSTTTAGGTADNAFSRLGAGNLMLSDTTTATKFTVSSTTDSLTSRTNYADAYLQAGINAGEFDLGSEHGGTGTALTKAQFNADGTAFLDYNKTAASTLTLPTALIALPGIGSDSGHTDVAICMDTTTHALYYGSGAGGACAL